MKIYSDDLKDLIMQRFYAAFGTDSGYLFGLPPEQRGTVAVIVKETLKFAEASFNADMATK